MMKARILALSVAIFLFALLIAVQAAGRTSDAIIVNSADEVKENAVGSSSDLAASLAGVGARVSAQFANEVRRAPMAIIPAALNNLLAQVADRIIVENANDNREFGLSYPGELIGDTTPPQGSDFAVIQANNNTVIVSWTTDERNSFIVILSKSLNTGYRHSFEPCDHSHRKSLSEYSAGIAALCAS